MRKTSIVVAASVASLIGAAGLLGGFAPEPRPSAPSDLSAAEYRVDPVHSSVVFRIRHAGVAPFYGVFKEFSGDFTFDPESPESASFRFEVQTASVDTRNSSRDDHLRNADFFNSRQFPTISFASTGIEPGEGEGVYRLKGDLTLMGETRPVTAEMVWIGTGTNPRGQSIGGFEANFSIKRSDFGMTKYLAPDGSESGGLGNTVTLMIGVEGIRG
jgi:polyisoprenoid-binding protein YceI